MKNILGLDLGTSSIGWALVRKAETNEEKSSIVRLGVRVNPLTVDEQRNFEQGKSITTNADRTLKRSMRRNLQRYKLRRDNLIKCLLDNGFIVDKYLLEEQGNNSTFQTYRLRALAAEEEISLQELSRMLLMINKKRGYKSSRKAHTADEGQLIDGMSVAKQLYEDDLTPGQFGLSLLQKGKRNIPDFYRSDLTNELKKIWNFQRKFYPEILTDDFESQILGKSKKQTSFAFLSTYEVYTAENKGKDRRLQSYKWRSEALIKQLAIEEVAFVVCELNDAIYNSSGYLGAISDRSKELFFNKQTVGQYLMSELKENPNGSLKNQVFYRQDYLDEFETIWEKQALYHPEMTPKLKKEIRDIIIFFQRPLKSQKGLVSFCEFENQQIEVDIDGVIEKKTIGSRVCPRSSPLFQEFKIWQTLNDILVIEKSTNLSKYLSHEEKQSLFNELSIRDKMSKTEVLKFLYKSHRDLDLNFKEIEGNRTQSAFYKAYQSLISMTGNGDYDFSKMNCDEASDIVTRIFKGLGYNTDFLTFDSSIEGKSFDKQPMYQLWHLLYSYESDNSKTGDESLLRKISELCGFEKQYATIIANIPLQPDYGSLSTKAMRKILIYLKSGYNYSDACVKAGYRHSERSLTAEELKNKTYVDRLDILPKNSLRNPVVEKILNQMINVVNEIVDTYGKPDEIRIELARELKKSAKEREDMVANINKATLDHEKYRQILQKEFGLSNVSRNDIIRYKLYLELLNSENEAYTLYSNTHIAKEKLFSKEFDIEHIIPQAKLFDDSFSNKTLEKREVNIEKSDMTAFDYILGKHDEVKITEYTNRIEALYNKKSIKKSKYEKLLTKEADIPNGFIERDLRDSQYIAKKAREILESMVMFVVPTTGSITARLRDDWQLVDVMQELNWEKYDRLQLTTVIEDKDGRKIRRIQDWTKRNDHRHHAMDALTIAFTKHSIIQYLNNLNARSDKSGAIYNIERKELERNKHGKMRFISPIMPLEAFRGEAKRQLENVLVSFKSKNKVVTRNSNKTKTKSGFNNKVQLTPRGQLHNETIYGSSNYYVTKLVNVGGSFDENQIAQVANKKYREALLQRLATFDNDPKKAFTGNNSLDKNPIFLDKMQTQQVPGKVKVVTFETMYTIRKQITPDLKIEKVVDVQIRRILEKRLAEFEGDAKKAFSNLAENPIWLNEGKQISIKRVSISGVNNADPLHIKKDKYGAPLLDADGRKQPVDYMNTGNNHHVAIYKDERGALQEVVVSFYEATTRASLGLPIVDRNYKQAEGWTFLFSMKQNEYFVFPNEKTGFNPFEIDLLDPDNYALISPNLFRVQKLTTMYYVFRHHLETTVEDKKELRDITWKRYQSFKDLDSIIKIRVNHIGRIVQVGEN